MLILGNCVQHECNNKLTGVCSAVIIRGLLNENSLRIFMRRSSGSEWHTPARHVLHEAESERRTKMKSITRHAVCWCFICASEGIGS